MSAVALNFIWRKSILVFLPHRLSTEKEIFHQSSKKPDNQAFHRVIHES
jgi:hypothetical protein